MDDSSIKEELDELENYFKKNRKRTKKRIKKNKSIKIAFAISLKSKRVARNWKEVKKRLASTLRSIFNNTDQNFYVIIAGHEKPKITELKDKRVRFIKVKFAPPKAKKHFAKDKIKKRRVIGKYLKKKGYKGYFMPLDADDWVHYRFVEYIRSHPVKKAFIFKKGFMTNLGLGEVWIRNNFYKSCGSGAVFYFRKTDFPNSSKRHKVAKTAFGLTCKPHPKVTKFLKKSKIKYKSVHHPLVTYVFGHNENISIIKGTKESDRTAEHYNAKGEELHKWFYDYFRSKN